MQHLNNTDTHNLHTERTQYAHTQHRIQNRIQDTEHRIQQYEHRTMNTEYKIQDNTEQHTEPQQNSAHNYRTYSLDYYHEYAYIKDSNTIELYTILQD